MKLNQPITLPSNLATLLNLHILGVGLLIGLNLFLATKLAVAWHDLGSGRQDELQQQQMTLAQLRVQTARLNGLPEKVEASGKQADKFYAERIPANYSSLLTELGSLAAKNNIRLTRAGYTKSPALEGLAEIRIDANLAGEYPSVMHFINGLERDKTFFLISGLTLTGQQGGLVNVRLRLITYLHAENAGDIPTSAPEEGDQPQASITSERPALQPASQEVQ